MPDSANQNDPEFVQRVLRYLDGALDGESLSVLNDELAADPAKRRAFVELCLIEATAWEDLSSQPVTPPQVNDAPEAFDPPPIQLTRRPRTAYRPTNWAGWAAAAVVVLAIGAVFLLKDRWSVQPHAAPTVVAHLTSERVARWDGTPPARGAALTAGSTFTLNSGCAELTFTDGAKVIVEAPARFAVDARTSMTLASGKLAASVLIGGFTVHTPNATVTDLGTEFGVGVNAGGRTDVAVFKGKVSAASRTSTPLVLTQGQAANVTAGAVALDPAGAIPQHYVRALASTATSLDLVDLLCGGDGTTRRRDAGIDLLKAAAVTTQTGRYTGDGAYHRFNDLTVLDGAFLPGGDTVVSSRGDRFTFPANDNVSFYNLWAGGKILGAGGNPQISATLAGVDYSTPAHSVLFMHGNKGITLDLAALRRLHPARSPARFHTLVGNSYPRTRTPKADVYLLVNGKPRVQRNGFTNADAPFTLDIPLAPTDRFLTIAVTDGGDSVDYDWVLLADAAFDLIPQP